MSQLSIFHNMWTTALSPKLGYRAFLTALALAVLAAVALGANSFAPASAQEDSECEVTELGSLSFEGDSSVEASGEWTTEDCDSRFRAGSDAHTFSLQIVDGGRVRIELSSAEGDPYIYLLSEDGRRITDNDDGGAGINARVERDLTPGVYLVEATTVGGRERGPADFTLTASYVPDCETVHLGNLGSEADLSATGSWSIDTCGSAIVVEHPAYRYSFILPEDGRVLIDLVSEHGDAVLSLISPTAGVISANDDGGDGRDARIKRYLPAGAYVVEATTYLVRDQQPLRAEFTLTISLVDEAAELQEFLLKVEETHAPDEVVAGVPFPVHYRVGNVGLGDLADVGGQAILYSVAPLFFDRGSSISAEDGLWQPHVSYHSGDVTATSGSTSLRGVKPFQVTLNSPGPSWVWVGVVSYDEDENEVGFHGNWRNLMVYSGYVFDPIDVRVDGLEYEVSAVADGDGVVTTTVTSSITPDAELPLDTRAEALYTAGVHTQMLDGLFDRPRVVGLPDSGEGEATSVANPSSRNLMKLFGEQYASALRETGIRADVRDLNSLNPLEVEDLLLDMAGPAEAEAISMFATWKGLQARVGDTSPMTFVDAFALHSQLAYTEKVLAPIIAAGEVVEAARAAEDGWEDEAVEAMVDEYEDAYSCQSPALIAIPLRRAEILDLGWMMTADTEMRAALPFYETTVDAVLCGNGADAENRQFFESLSIDEGASLLRMFDIAPPPTLPATPYRLRILSRLGDDGRIEHGVELRSGEQIFPEMRHLPADSAVDEWVVGGDVMVDDLSIGQIRSRRLEDGRVEVGFVVVTGRTISPRPKHLPSNAPEGVWFRSGNVTVPRPAGS